MFRPKEKNSKREAKYIGFVKLFGCCNTVIWNLNLKKHWIHNSLFSKATESLGRYKQWKTNKGINSNITDNLSIKIQFVQ